MKSVISNKKKEISLKKKIKAFHLLNVHFFYLIHSTDKKTKTKKNAQVFQRKYLQKLGKL